MEQIPDKRRRYTQGTPVFRQDHTRIEIVVTDYTPGSKSSTSSQIS